MKNWIIATASILGLISFFVLFATSEVFQIIVVSVIVSVFILLLISIVKDALDEAPKLRDK